MSDAVETIEERLRELPYWGDHDLEVLSPAGRKIIAMMNANAVEAADLIKEMRAALAEGRRAIGDHWAPSDCYATGPLTGDPIRDLIECPACSFIAKYDAALKRAEERS